MVRSRPLPLAVALVPFLLALYACGGDDGGSGPPRVTASFLSLEIRPPDTVTAGVPFARQPVVQLFGSDQFARAEGGIVVTVTTSSGTLHGTTTATTASTGQATFTNLALDGTSGPRTLTFSSPGLQGITATTYVIAARASSGR